MSELFSDILEKRLSRRSVLASAGVTIMASQLPLKAATAMSPVRMSTVLGTLNFISVPKDYTEGLRVAAGYQAKPLISWGDAVTQTPSAVSASKQQATQFGYNNDFTAYLPIDGSSAHGLLHVNHEYTNAHLMFPNTHKKDSTLTLSQEQLRVEQQAHGVSVLEVKRDGKGDWSVVPNSHYARRITATTPIAISGPVAGNPRLQTKQDPSGKQVLGTIGNCAGGVTPWGTVLVAEENIDGYFVGKTTGKEKQNHKRYTIAKKSYYGWARIDDRFNVTKTPNEPNRFGWVVEYNLYDPNSQPVKRTALGRFKHESATVTFAPSGQVVVYSGDDDYFEYIYRYVSKGKYDPDNPSANATLLDEGTLFVAKFDEGGKLSWIPLIYGQNGLTKDSGFHSQADVLIEARRAGDVVGATKMDRPEGIAIHPKTGGVYVALTRNPKRKETNIANPRRKNIGGHIIQMVPPASDHAADEFGWEITMLAGDPDEDAPDYGGRIAKADWFGSPDNLAFHPNGTLYIATDGMPKSYGVADGLYVYDGKQPPKCMLAAPKGAEVTGPSFTPDGKTLFLSIQHPGEDKGSTYDTPSTRWPDFDPNTPPKPTVVAVSAE